MLDQRQVEAEEREAKTPVFRRVAPLHSPGCGLPAAGTRGHTGEGEGPRALTVRAAGSEETSREGENSVICSHLWDQGEWPGAGVRVGVDS